MQKNIGLTGGIGAGKSIVAARLASHGAVVISADELSREVVAPGTEGYDLIVETFGPDILTAQGAIDRLRLADRVFSNDEDLARLNAIVHPRVRARARAIARSASSDAIVVQDIPLIVEVGLESLFDLIVVVEAPLEQRLARLVKRGVGELEAQRRMAQQTTDERRRVVADIILTNDGNLDELYEKVDRLWEQLRRR